MMLGDAIFSRTALRIALFGLIVTGLAIIEYFLKKYLPQWESAIAYGRCVLIVAGAVVIFRLLPSKKKLGYFYCIRCEYDLRGSLHSPRCPECGHLLEIGKDKDIPYTTDELRHLKIAAGDKMQEAERDNPGDSGSEKVS